MEHSIARPPSRSHWAWSSLASPGGTSHLLCGRDNAESLRASASVPSWKPRQGKASEPGFCEDHRRDEGLGDVCAPAPGSRYVNHLVKHITNINTCFAFIDKETQTQKSQVSGSRSCRKVSMAALQSQVRAPPKPAFSHSGPGSLSEPCRGFTAKLKHTRRFLKRSFTRDVLK